MLSLRVNRKAYNVDVEPETPPALGHPRHNRPDRNQGEFLGASSSYPAGFLGRGPWGVYLHLLGRSILNQGGKP